jgi:hypothetical protein
MSSYLIMQGSQWMVRQSKKSIKINLETGLFSHMTHSCHFGRRQFKGLAKRVKFTPYPENVEKFMKLFLGENRNNISGSRTLENHKKIIPMESTNLLDFSGLSSTFKYFYILICASLLSFMVEFHQSSPIQMRCHLRRNRKARPKRLDNKERLFVKPKRSQSI